VVYAQKAVHHQSKHPQVERECTDVCAETLAMGTQRHCCDGICKAQSASALEAGPKQVPTLVQSLARTELVAAQKSLWPQNMDPLRLCYR
jgi:hypothetical protein